MATTPGDGTNNNERPRAVFRTTGKIAVIATTSNSRSAAAAYAVTATGVVHWERAAAYDVVRWYQQQLYGSKNLKQHWWQQLGISGRINTTSSNSRTDNGPTSPSAEAAVKNEKAEGPALVLIAIALTGASSRCWCVKGTLEIRMFPLNSAGTLQFSSLSFHHSLNMSCCKRLFQPNWNLELLYCNGVVSGDKW